MADQQSKKEAHKFIQEHGKTVAQLPGGKEAMGFEKQGVVKDSLAARAQSHLGDVNKANAFPGIQRDAMKK